MLLCKVIGNVVSTQKLDYLLGAKLLIVAVIDKHGKNIINDQTYVVADYVGAGKGDLVLVDSTNDSGKEHGVYNSIVALVENIEIY